MQSRAKERNETEKKSTFLKQSSEALRSSMVSCWCWITEASYTAQDEQVSFLPKIGAKK